MLLGLLSFAVYFTGARIAYALALPGGVVAIWLPSGIMLGFLLVTKQRQWPAILIGQFVASVGSDLVAQYPLAFSLAAGAANTLESFAAAWFLTRHTRRAHQRFNFSTPRNVLEFLWRAPLASNAVTSLVGGLVLHQWVRMSWMKGWFVWWAGDGLGMLIVAPVIVVWARPIARDLRGSLRRLKPLVIAEIVALTAALIGAAVLTLGNPFVPFRPGPYIVFPVLFWAALRFGPRGASGAIFIVAGVATWHAALGTGPFVRVGLSGIQIASLLYMYLAAVTLSTLVSASVVEERKEASARYRSVVDAATDVVITIGEDSTVEFVSAAVAPVFGYTPGEVIGRDLTMLMPESFRLQHHEGLARYLETGQRRIAWRGVALPGLHRDGHEIPLEVSFGELTVGGRRYVTGIMRDLTERRALEAQFRQSQKMEALGQLAGGVAHDFNNLLTAIHGYSSMVLDALPPASVEREDMGEILKATKRAESLTRQLLAFSRRQIISPKVIDLGLAIRNVEPMLRRLIGEDIELAVVAPTSVPILVRADPGLMEQVILNLAVNSRDAMPMGGTLTLEVSRLTGGTPVAVVLVRDTGSGMSDETRERLFEPFYTTKSPGKGTGLGLATVHGIVKQSGGTITVESELGLGTTFRMELPLLEGVAEPQSGARSLPVRPRTETILVAEDDPALRQLISRVLEQQGYQVLLAESPSEALAIVRGRSEPVDLLLTDVVMPEMNGRALAAEISELQPGIPVLYMSGYTDDEIMKREVREQDVNFIQKPFDPETLRASVAEALDEPVSPLRKVNA